MNTIRRLASFAFIAAFVLTGLGGAARAENIVVIGDSLTCGPFGDSLFQSLNTNGNHVTFYCEGSSHVESWVTNTLASGAPCQTRSSEKPTLHQCGEGKKSGQIPPLAEILAAHIGEKFIVALGTNRLWSDPNYARLAEVIKLSGSTCTWLGPPHYRPDQVYLNPTSGFTVKGVTWCDAQLPSFYQMLSSSVGNYCDIVDSRAATAPGTPGNETADGIHKGLTASNYWVSQILPQLTSNTSNKKVEASPSSPPPVNVTPVAQQPQQQQCEGSDGLPTGSEGARLFRQWAAIGRRCR